MVLFFLATTTLNEAEYSIIATINDYLALNLFAEVAQHVRRAHIFESVAAMIVSRFGLERQFSSFVSLISKVNAV